MLKGTKHNVSVTYQQKKSWMKSKLGLNSHFVSLPNTLHNKWEYQKVLRELLENYWSYGLTRAMDSTEPCDSVPRLNLHKWNRQWVEICKTWHLTGPIHTFKKNSEKSFIWKCPAYPENSSKWARKQPGQVCTQWKSHAPVHPPPLIFPVDYSIFLSFKSL